MNIPNFLTILRILAIPLFIILIAYEHYPLALILFIGAAITDAMDGFLARTFKQKTTLGSYLDPIADKLLLTSSFVVFSIMKLIPAWLSILVISRDIIILLGILVLLVNFFPVEIHPTAISKCTTVFQLFSIGITLLFHVMHKAYIPLQVVFWTTGIFTVISGIDYVSKGLKIINEREQ
ncbi:MAG: CDP-diacylglycerol--glycerol-3-phosphate 3-phosphatidyltransferase [Proteobacteria bacterium]|nr:CDP-diacylglycerol--glycerol-3-phosphate 3-phosphatidyltransferase [Pseudomonadota bacterium]